jgi:hypothetical protein
MAAITTQGRLLLKTSRFELVTSAMVAALVGIAALVATIQLLAVGVDRACLLNYVASVDVSPECGAAVSLWADASEGLAGKVMAAMAVLPLAVGVLVGVPLVGRELEGGTAALTWALAGSRGRWLMRQVIPAIMLTTGIAMLAAIPATWLADVRSAGGVWTSTFGDADLFGVAVIARAVAALAIGLVCGAIIGRLLPAVIVSAALVALIPACAAMAQPLAAKTSIDAMNVGGPGYVSRLLADNPDIDIRLVNREGLVVKVEDAARAAPPGSSISTYLDSSFRPVALGVKSERTLVWQLLETAGLGVLAFVLIAVTRWIVERRRPA